MPYEGLGGPAITIPALGANFSKPAGTNQPYWWQDGSGLVHIGGTALGAAGTGLQNVWASGTLPAFTIRPTNTALFIPISAIDGTLATCEITTSGALWILNAVASKTWCFDGVTYLGGY